MADSEFHMDVPNFRPHHTSEFALDAEDDYAGGGDEQEYQLNEQIQNFIRYFYNHVRQQNVYEIQEIYETTWHKLTDRYFKNQRWPPAEAISPLVEGDEVFLPLYNELYYRHLYAKLKPTEQDRKDSWNNYMALFALVLDPALELEERISLPSSWLWDMMDEFVYQYQSFAHYRCKLKVKTDEELAFLSNECEGVWETNAVLKTLHDLTKYSNIVAHLDKLDASGKSAQHEELDMLKMLGYYSVICLLRVHNLLGDYRLALKQLDPIDISRRGLLGRVMACHITTYYYMGFAYMMSRRYMDAIKALSNILLYINRTKQYHTRSAAYDIIVKKNERHQGPVQHPLVYQPHQAVPHALCCIRHHCQEERADVCPVGHAGLSVPIRAGREPSVSATGKVRREGGQDGSWRGRHLRGALPVCMP